MLCLQHLVPYIYTMYMYMYHTREMLYIHDMYTVIHVGICGLLLFISLSGLVGWLGDAYKLTFS